MRSSSIITIAGLMVSVVYQASASPAPKPTIVGGGSTTPDPVRTESRNGYPRASPQEESDCILGNGGPSGPPLHLAYDSNAKDANGNWIGFGGSQDRCANGCRGGLFVHLTHDFSAGGGEPLTGYELYDCQGTCKDSATPGSVECGK